MSATDRAPRVEPPTGLRRGGILAAGAIAASVATTLCSLLATLIILRALSESQAGTFAFIVELLYAVGMLGSLGQPILQARIYQQSGAANLNWVRDAVSTFFITIPFVVAGVCALAAPYRLSLLQGIFLVIGGELFILITCFSSVLGQQRSYAWASALLRLSNGLLIIPAILMLVIPSLARLGFVLLCLVGFLFGTTLLGAVLLIRRLQSGDRHITLRQRVTGLVFLASLLALLVPQRGSVAIAGAMLEPANVAALAAIVSILRVFDLVGDSAGRVFSTEMARDPERISWGLFVAPWLLASAMAAVVIFFLPPIVHRFYTGRYDVALPLLPWLVLAAALRLVEVVPRGFLAYLAPARVLRRFAGAQCIAAIGGIALMVGWTTNRGLSGLVWAAAAVAVVRLVISYGFLIPLRTKGSLATPSVQDGLVETLEPGGEESPV